MSDKNLVKLFGTTANAQNFRALLIRGDEPLVKDLDGDWKNEPGVYRQGVRDDSLNGFEPVRDARGRNLIPFLSWKNRRLLTERETELYWDNLPAQQTQAVRTRSSAQDW